VNVRVDAKGVIWVSLEGDRQGAVMLYGPFTEDERDSVTRMILGEMRDPAEPRVCWVEGCGRPHQARGMCG
jgi:hypothetical protein